MPKSLSKKEEFKNLKIDCEETISKNISEFNSLLENLKEKVAFLENIKKNVVEKDVSDIQKKLGVLEERKELSFNQNQIENIIIDSIKIDNNPIKQKYNSGIFTGLFYGIILSVIFLVGIVFYFAQLSGIEISKDLILESTKYNSLFKEISFGQDPLFAKIGLGLISLILISISMLFSQSIEDRSNFKKVNIYRKNIGEFELNVGDKSILIKDINNHLDQYVKALKIYSALLSEESGKLDRIIFFEQHSSDIEGTEKPMTDIYNTQEMLFYLDKLISTDILTEGGFISVDSIGALNNSIDYLNIYIKALYSNDKYQSKGVLN